MKKTLVKMRAAYMEEAVMIKDSDIFHHYEAKDLPISESLKHDIQKWEDEYQATLDREYPPDSAFPSPEAEKAHIKEGAKLAKRLQTELGDSYLVKYIA